MRILLLHGEKAPMQMTMAYTEAMTGSTDPHWLALFGDPDKLPETKGIPKEHRFGLGSPEELSIDAAKETLRRLSQS